MGENKFECKLPRKKHFLLIVGVMFIIPMLGLTNVSADGGMIPYHEFSVYEPGQKAIIAWDGQEEIMILSVDVYSEQSTKALHMVPFPSLPEVELGSVESFDKIEEIINRNNWGYGGGHDDKNGNQTIAPGIENVEIVFHEKVGAHDITAVKINSPIEFSDWVNNFLEGKGIANKELPDELDTVVAHYTDQEIRYFVFDVIELDSNKRSVNPIIYRFETNYLFFPLEISSIIEGYTEITLALITPDDLPINPMALSDLGFHKEYDDFISNSDLIEINEDIAKMFEDTGCLRLYQGHFSLKDLKNDVVIRRLANVNWMIGEQSYIENTQIVDLNGDGIKEIKVECDNRINVYNAKNGKVDFEFKRSSDTGLRIKDCQFGDIDSDGTTDAILITWDNEIKVFDGNDNSELWNYEIEFENGYYSANNIRYLGRDATKNIIFYTSEKIYSLYGLNGAKLWEHKIEDSNRIKEIIICRFNNLDFNILSFDYNNKLTMLDGHNGNALWETDLPGYYMEVLITNINNNANQEIICRVGRDIYVLDSDSGEINWVTTLIEDKWSSITNFNACDFNNDGVSEIFVYRNPSVFVLDGKNGKLDQKFDIQFEELGLSNIRYVEIGDFDNDNNLELLLDYYTKLLVLEKETGNIIWNFTTGEYISDFKVEDLDNDNNDEIVMITENNKLYTIEYVQDPKSTGDSEWHDTRGIILGSILVLIISVVIIILLIVRVIDKYAR
jgi:outer membrane protein assembly factor BamB